MSVVALLDRDRVQQPAAPDAEAMRVDDAGHAGSLELAQQQRRSQVLAVAVRLVRRLVRGGAEDDRIVAGIDGPDLEYRLRALAGGGIPRPPARRTPRRLLVVMEGAPEG